MALRKQQQEHIKSYSPFPISGLYGTAQTSSDSASEERNGTWAGLVKGGRRRDGRTPEECRAAFLKLGTVTSAAGSAYMECGNTKVLVSVFGPREGRADGATSQSSTTGQLNTHVTIAPFARPLRAPQGTQAEAEEKELARMLHSSLTPSVQLHAFPKAVVDVMALVLECGGSEASVLIQCASAALADAAVPLYDLVSCTTVIVWQLQVLLDPSEEEEREEEGRLTLALMPTADQVTLLSFAGDLHPQQLSEAVDLALGGCAKLADVVRSGIKEDVQATL